MAKSDTLCEIWNGFMFETLKGKLQTVFDGLAKRGALSEADVDVALREVRLALLDADVSLPVVKSFIENCVVMQLALPVCVQSGQTNKSSRLFMMRWSKCLAVMRHH